MVLQRYRIFTAMLALGEFTVQDLAAASQTSPSTVRTTLARSGHLVEGIGRAAPERRGGRWNRYRLRPEGADELRAKLEEVQQIRTESWLAGPPSELLAAEELLLLPMPDDSEVRQSRVRRARRLLNSGRRATTSWGNDVKSKQRAEATSHVRAVELLLRLADAEAQEDSAAALAGFEAACADLERCKAQLSAARTESSLYADLRLRLQDSPIAREAVAEPEASKHLLARVRTEPPVDPLSVTLRAALRSLSERTAAVGAGGYAETESPLTTAARLAQSMFADIVIKITPAADRPRKTTNPRGSSYLDIDGCQLTVTADPKPLRENTHIVPGVSGSVIFVNDDEAIEEAIVTVVDDAMLMRHVGFENLLMRKMIIGRAAHRTEMLSQGGSKFVDVTAQINGAVVPKMFMQLKRRRDRGKLEGTVIVGDVELEGA